MVQWLNLVQRGMRVCRTFRQRFVVITVVAGQLVELEIIFEKLVDAPSDRGRGSLVQDTSTHALEKSRQNNVLVRCKN